MQLPDDPSILQSLLNTWLRDYYSNLDELCEARDISRDELEARLSAAGLEYNAELNKVW